MKLSQVEALALRAPCRIHSPRSARLSTFPPSRLRSSTREFVRRLLALTLVLGAMSAQAALYNSPTLNQAIPDNSASGYANTINVSGPEGFTITDVNVHLNISGGWNGDLYVTLVHNNSGAAILLNRVGRNGSGEGFGDAGFNVWLDDTGVNGDIHLFGTGSSPVAGTFQPDGRAVDPANVANGDARSAMLNQFNGQNPNGTWTIFLADNFGSYESRLDSWSLEITAVPEPVTVALGLFGGVCGLVGLFRWLRPRA